MSSDHARDGGFHIVQLGGCEDDPHTLIFEAEIGKISINVVVGAAIDDFKETGQVIWPAAPLLSYFLLTKYGQDIIKGRNIVELGAGVGVPGLICAQFAPFVVLTDHNPASLRLLAQNAAINQQSCLTNVSVASLDWDSQVPMDLVSKFDIVIGADLVFSTLVVTSLFSTAKNLLASHPAALFILSHVSR